MEREVAVHRTTTVVIEVIIVAPGGNEVRRSEGRSARRDGAASPETPLGKSVSLPSKWV
jgi:hypothetical protein